jgi:hypothetical protein
VDKIKGKKMEYETGTISVAVISSVVLGFAFWIIKKINEI